MRYRVVFVERTDEQGNNIEDPPEFVEPELTDGVVLDCRFVERFEAPNMHVQETPDEDDSFLSMGTEVWEYDVADGRDQEFKDALVNSEMVIEFEEIDDSPSEAA